jgi:uncharacterized protein YbcV (DUF1398 family)
MFTLSEINKAHSKVKSWADFPAYAREIHGLGVTGYDVFVFDGHAEYFWNPETLISPPKYDSLEVGKISDTEKFREKLKLHQNGGTDYMTFCRDSAECGVEKWTLDLELGTCTYYDRGGNSLIVEHFPN